MQLLNIVESVESSNREGEYPDGRQSAVVPVASPEKRHSKTVFESSKAASAEPYSKVEVNWGVRHSK